MARASAFTGRVSASGSKTPKLYVTLPACPEQCQKSNRLVKQIGFGQYLQSQESQHTDHMAVVMTSIVATIVALLLTKRLLSPNAYNACLAIILDSFRTQALSLCHLPLSSCSS